MKINIIKKQLNEELKPYKSLKERKRKRAKKKKKN
jgi:hypothetical protein